MELIEKEEKGKAFKEKKQRKINIREKGGHNSEPIQKQNCNCESIKELVKNKKKKYNDNSKIKQKYSLKEKQSEKSWTQ